MNEETVEHVVVEHPGEPEPAPVVVDAAPAVVETAAAAVALADATAAAAELDAAERMRRLEEEGAAWRNQIAESVNQLSGSLTLLREEELQRHATERSDLLAAQVALSERMAAWEARYPLSTPESSETAGENTGENSEGARIVGAEGTAGLGPVEATAGASLESSSGETNNPTNHRRGNGNHRWI